MSEQEFAALEKRLEPVIAAGGAGMLLMRLLGRLSVQATACETEAEVCGMNPAAAQWAMEQLVELSGFDLNEKRLPALRTFPNRGRYGAVRNVPPGSEVQQFAVVLVAEGAAGLGVAREVEKALPANRPGSPAGLPQQEAKV